MPSLRRDGAGRPDPAFRGKALLLQTSAEREVILAGPSETGKTFACCWHLDTLLRRYPRARAALVRKTRVSMDATVLQTFRDVTLWRGGARPFGGERPEWFDYDNGSRCYVVGMDRPEKILSGEFDFICVNQCEELTLADYETLTSRATGRAGHAPYPQVFGDCNPGPPSHWLRHRTGLNLWESRHEDNPTLFDDGGKLTPRGERALSVLDALTGVRHLRLRKGLWVQADGIVYEGWDPALHVADPFPVPADWPRYLSVDFGYTNPFVCQWYAEDPDGRLYLYREVYRTGRLVEDHAREIARLSAGEPRPRAVVCDHDAGDRATLERHLRLPTTPARKEVGPGIQSVAARLKPAGDGRPRLFLVRHALAERDPSLAEARRPCCTQEEWEGYVWKQTPGGVREEPEKRDDHGLDALRYLVHWLDGARRTVHYSRPRPRPAARR